MRWYCDVCTLVWCSDVSLCVLRVLLALSLAGGWLWLASIRTWNRLTEKMIRRIRRSSIGMIGVGGGGYEEDMGDGGGSGLVSRHRAGSHPPPRIISIQPTFIAPPTPEPDGHNSPEPVDHHPHSRRPHTTQHLAAPPETRPRRASSAAKPTRHVSYRHWLRLLSLGLLVLAVCVLITGFILSLVVPVYHSHAHRRCDGVSVDRFSRPLDSPEHPLRCFPELNQIETQNTQQGHGGEKANTQTTTTPVIKYLVPNHVHFVYGLAGQSRGEERDASTCA